VPGGLSLPKTLFDIFVIAIIVYFVLKVIQASKALQLFQGLVIFLFALVAIDYVSEWFGMIAVNWVVRQTLQLLPSALPVFLAVLFQPELRKALGSLGRKSIFGKPIDLLESEEVLNVVKAVSSATSTMSARKCGALIAIERQVGLTDFETEATKLDALVTSSLLESIFFPGSAMHDGGVVIKGDRISSARCVFPLATDPTLESEIGTRHRAALGLSEETDAIVIAVSETTGIISMATSGSLTRHLSPVELEGLLKYMLAKPEKSWFGRQKKNEGHRV
jgi:diadenylate cyclase